MAIPSRLEVVIRSLSDSLREWWGSGARTTVSRQAAVRAFGPRENLTGYRYEHAEPD